MEIHIKLNEILQKKDMTQKTLADITGLRPATVSELCNNQRTTFNKNHLIKIIKVLDIKDIGELLVIKRK